MYDDSYQTTAVHKVINCGGVILWIMCSLCSLIYFINLFDNLLINNNVTVTIVVLAYILALTLMSASALFVLIMFPISLLDDYIHNHLNTKHQ